VELKRLKVKNYLLSGENIPQSLSGKRIALLCDTHCVSHGRDNIRLLDMLKKEDPDYIVISGDLINGRDSSELRYARHLLKNLNDMKVPVLYTFGNHEEKLRKNSPRAYKRLRRIAAKYTIPLNNGAYIPDREGFMFTGINLPLSLYHAHDRNGFLKRRTERILKDKDSKGLYNILVAHDPEHFNEYSECGYDLCLTGHLHGGIICFPFLGGFISPRFQFFNKRAKGLFKTGKMNMIVSGGIGWHDVPLRLFNRPEIVMIDFEHKGE